MAWFGQWQGATTGQWWGDGGFVPPIPDEIPSGGSAKRLHRRKRHYVEIDGQYFEVRNAEHAEEVLRQAREVAEVAAPVAAAVTEPVTVPRVRVVKPDYQQEFFQQLQAQVDAANAAIAAVYRDAVAAQALVAKRQAEDEDDIVALIAIGVL